jgi:epoxyqueuosine reductase
MEELSAQELLLLDGKDLQAFVEKSPLRRPGREGLARNAAIVLGNARDKRSLPVLQRAAEHDESEVVRDAARWAVDAITRPTGDAD